MTKHPLFTILEIQHTSRGIDVTMQLDTRHALVTDHIVQNEAIIAGACWLEIIASIAAQVLVDHQTISNLIWLMPLYVNTDTVKLCICLTMKLDQYDIQVFHNDKEITRAILNKSTPTNKAPRQLDVVKFKGSAEGMIDKALFYEKLHSLGFQYGSAYHQIEHLWFSKEWSLSELSTIEEAEAFIYPPATVDAALQTSLGIAYAKGSGESAHLPFSIKSIRNYGSMSLTRYIYCIANVSADTMTSYHIFYLDSDHRVLVFMQDFTGRRILKR